MERKIYQLCTFTLDQFNEIHDELTTSTNGLSNVPDREVECTDKKTHSETRGIFLLTEDEAAALENDDRIKSINLNYKDYPYLKLMIMMLLMKNCLSHLNVTLKQKKIIEIFIHEGYYLQYLMRLIEKGQVINYYDACKKMTHG